MIISIMACGQGMPKNEQLLFNQYLKRIPVKVEVLEIAGSIFPEKALHHSINKKGSHIILHQSGKTYTSEGFAEQLQHWLHQTPIYFYIGGSNGYEGYEQLRTQSFKTLAHQNHAVQLLSFGSMTFPHMLMRILLIEQLYRAFCITSHHPYHH